MPNVDELNGVQQTTVYWTLHTPTENPDRMLKFSKWHGTAILIAHCSFYLARRAYAALNV